MVRHIGLIICALVLSACAGRPLPQATPTVAPTRTASPTPPIQIALNPTRTPIPTLTHTLILSLSPTREPSQTDTPAPTDTPTLTVEPSNTALPRFEPTRTQSATPTSTLTLTPTLTPSLSPTPTETFTPEPSLTFTPTLTLTPSATVSLSATPQPTVTTSQTASAQPSNTITPAPSSSATAGLTSTATIDPFLTTTAWTWTPIPSPTDTVTVTPTVPQIAPTLDLTPTFATLAPDQPTPVGGISSQTPVQGDATQFAPSTPTPAPTVANVNPPPTLALSSILIPPSASVGVPLGFALGSGGAGAAFTLPTQGELSLFVRNPRDASQYLTTDVLGFYSLIVNGQSQGLSAPFTGFYPESRAANDQLVTDAAWSPDGRFVALVIDNPDQKQGSDGVWWYEPGVNAPTQVMVNCRPGAPGCGMVQPVGAPYNWHAASVVWSPDSQRILARTFMYADDFNGQMGALVLERGTDRSTRGHLIPYEYTDWTSDGARLVVSGRSSIGGYVFGTVGLDGQDFQAVTASGQLWVQNAVQTSGGLVGLGRAGDMNGAMRLVNQNGDFLTGDIGGSRPLDVKWNPERSVAFVRTEDGRAYLASINGQVEDLSGRIGDIQAVAWVQGELPPILTASSPGTGENYVGGIPSGVIEGSLYPPGQQLLIQSGMGRLNLRTEPSITAGVVIYVSNGEYVAVLAGPADTQEGGDVYRWWRVQTAAGAQGWMAGAINGAPTFVVP